jgi:hypothetical protein
MGCEQVRPVVETGYENILLVRLLLEIKAPHLRQSSVMLHIFSASLVLFVYAKIILVSTCPLSFGSHGYVCFDHVDGVNEEPRLQGRCLWRTF